MNWLLLAASMRKDSLNKKLLSLAEKKMKELHINANHISFESLNIPLYNGDVEAAGIPKEVSSYAKKIIEADAWVISLPEYNFSTPGTLKNLFDWISRVRPLPVKNKPVLLMSASPSLVGGNRGLWATRVPLEACGAFVFPSMFSLSNAHEALDEKGKLKDKTTDERLSQLILEFKNHVEKLLR